MLVLRRKKDESIIIAGIVEVKILRIFKNRVQLGIEGPRKISVHRKEVQESIENQSGDSGIEYLI